jgi:uncharacterized protein involved in exopolysaccharide biosynthesis
MATSLDDEFDGSADRQARPGLPVDPGRLWLSVKRDWRWIPLAGLTWGALGLLVAFVFIRYSYKSEAVLVWQPKTEGRADDRQLATQAAGLKMPGTLQLVKARLKLGIPIALLDKQIDVFFDTHSNLVTVAATGASAQDAVTLANSVLETFLLQQRSMARARAEEVGKALEKDNAAAHAQLDQARKAFDAFRAEHGVVDIEHDVQLAIDNAARLNEQHQQAQGETTTLAARISGLDAETRKHQRTSVQAASTTNPNAQKLAELQTELSTARARYSPEHPRIASLQAQIASLQANSGKSTAVSSVTTGANPEYQTLQQSLSATRAEQEAADKRVKSLEQFAREAEERVEALRAVQGKAQAFVADIELIQKRVTDLETQLSEAHDAARTPQIDWRVLTPAIEPEWPERSKRRAVAAGMPIAGMLVALFALLLRPTLDGRVYTAREAGYWANLPVLASSSWPRNREMFFTLIDELGDHGTAARGYTLVLGASGREKAQAEELAYWLGGHAVGSRRQHAATTRVEVGGPMGSARPTAPDGAGQPSNFSSGPVSSSEALVPLPRQPAGGLSYPAEGTHAWLGAADGPALRRAARMADRVIVLLSSGGESFTSIAGLRTRLGRDSGVGLVLLGLSTELLKLPDRVGNVDGFWRSNQSRRDAVA